MDKKGVCLNVCKILVLSGLFVGGSAVIGDTTPLVPKASAVGNGHKEQRQGKEGQGHRKEERGHHNRKEERGHHRKEKREHHKMREQRHESREHREHEKGQNGGTSSTTHPSTLPKSGATTHK